MKMSEMTNSSDRVISLTLTSQYARSWGTWEGVRELVQNWHDGIYDAVKYHNVETDYEIVFRQVDDKNCKFTACLSVPRRDDIILGRLVFDKFSNRLVLINSATELHKKILLLGYSGKSKDKEVIGQFGEGLKVGALALVRDGHLVAMETCNDRWMFELLFNEDFGEKVLSVVVSDRGLDTCMQETPEELLGMMGSLRPSDTCTSVSGLSLQDWKQFLPRFLFLQPPEDSVKTELGTLLLDTRLSGQLYVKGLWVSDLSNEDLSAGVNILSLQLDRDRNAVPKPSEIDHLLSCIWVKAVERRPELNSRYFELLRNDKYRDVRHAVEYSSESVVQTIAKQFLREFGDFGFPVLDSSTIEEINSVQKELRLTAVLCNKTLLEILYKSGNYKTLTSALGDLRAGQRRNVPFFSLSQEERVVMETVQNLLMMADISLETSVMDVTETSTKEVCHSTDNGERVLVPRWYLNKDQVHKLGKLCPADDSGVMQCFCREMRLFSSILKVQHKSFVLFPDVLIPDLLGSPSTKFEDEALLRILHKMLSNSQSSKDDRINDTSSCQNTQVKDTNSCQSTQVKVTGVNIESEQNLEIFVARETKYLEKIHCLEKQLDEEKIFHSKTLTDITQKLQKVEKELIAKEVSLVNEEDSIRARFEDQLKVYRKRAEHAVEEIQGLVSERDQQIMNLKQSVQHKERLLNNLNAQMESLTSAADKRSATLLEELSHYIAQNKSRTKSLAHLCTEKIGQGDHLSNGKWLLLKDLCDVILEDLQKEKVFCSVCLQKRKNCVLQPCGHYCLCEECVLQLYTSPGKCPLCKALIVSYQKVYE